MRKVILTGIILSGFFICCKKEEAKTEAVTVKEATSPAEEPVVTECYQGILKKDTFRLSVNTKGTVVPSGRLTYNFFEKDKNEGTIRGVMSGDTLFADYTYMSEGKTSVREVVFLKKGNIFIEGYGDTIDDNKGKVVFKDKKKLFFDSKTVLMKMDCK